jgi:hypothetical protein
MNAIKFCAGTGGQALGLKQAVFHHSGFVKIEPHYSAKLRRDARRNRAASDMAFVGEVRDPKLSTALTGTKGCSG